MSHLEIAHTGDPQKLFFPWSLQAVPFIPGDRSHPWERWSLLDESTKVKSDFFQAISFKLTHPVSAINFQNKKKQVSKFRYAPEALPLRGDWQPSIELQETLNHWNSDAHTVQWVLGNQNVRHSGTFQKAKV